MAIDDAFDVKLQPKVIRWKLDKVNCNYFWNDLCDFLSDDNEPPPVVELSIEQLYSLELPTCGCGDLFMSMACFVWALHGCQAGNLYRLSEMLNDCHVHLLLMVLEDAGLIMHSYSTYDASLTLAGRSALYAFHKYGFSPKVFDKVSCDETWPFDEHGDLIM